LTIRRVSPSGNLFSPSAAFLSSSPDLFSPHFCARSGSVSLLHLFLGLPLFDSRPPRSSGLLTSSWSQFSLRCMLASFCEKLWVSFSLSQIPRSMVPNPCAALTPFFFGIFFFLPRVVFGTCDVKDFPGGFEFDFVFVGTQVSLYFSSGFCPAPPSRQESPYFPLGKLFSFF